MANKLFKLMSTTFDSFDNTIKTYLAKVFGSLGMEYTHTQIFGVIFDGVKGVMQNALFYIEDALTEQNIFMASRKKSIYSLAKLSGYEPYYGACATGILNCKIMLNKNLQSTSSKLYINNYTQVKNKLTGITYILYMNTDKYIIDINSPLVYHNFKIIQGSYTNVQYVSTGEPLEKISVDVSGLFDRDYFEVLVNGEKWDMVGSLYDMSTDSKTYVLTVGYENTFDVVFGNGVYGKIPESGATIQINYLSHGGSIGNIGINSKSEFVFNQNGYDSLGNSINLNNYIKLSVQNVISGGNDADSIKFVREMIGTNSRSNVLATEDNFRLFFKRFSFIGNVNCWSNTNSMIINAVCTSNVLDNITEYADYYNLKPSDLVINNDQKQMIISTLNNSNKAFVGMTLEFKDPIIRSYAIICYVKIKNIYLKSVVEEDIKVAFAKYFINLKDNVQFIAKSDLITIGLNASTEIESFDLNIISGLAEDTYYKGYYYKYELKLINDTYQYVQTKVLYEKYSTPGLDAYGNIQLDSKLEIPMLSLINYYMDKETNNKTNLSKINAIQCVFI